VDLHSVGNGISEIAESGSRNKKGPPKRERRRLAKKFARIAEDYIGAKSL
jgi:hypothetical protein